MGRGVARRSYPAGAGVYALPGSSRTGHHTIAVYAAFVAVPRLALRRFGSFVGIDLAFAEVPHRVVLGRTFLVNVILIYDGFRAQVTFASSLDPY